MSNPAREPIVDELAKCRCRISQLERHLETEVEIVHDIACEAESAQAGEVAALERVAELEYEISLLKTWMTDHGLVVPQFEAAE